MTNLKNQRVGLLIDSENIEIEAENYYGRRVDYQKLLQTADRREVIRALYFKPFNKINRYQEKRLTEIGLEVKITQKNSDSWLTVSAITLAEKCDVIVLIAGDADYLPLIWLLQSRGVRVEVWMFASCTSAKIRELADSFTPLTEEFLLNKPNKVLSLTVNQRRY